MRNRKKQRHVEQRANGKLGLEPTRFAPMRPSTCPDGAMMTNKPLDGSTFRRMFTFMDTPYVIPKGTRVGRRDYLEHDETFVAPGLPVLADLTATTTRAKKRPGWAFNSKHVKPIANSRKDKRKP